MQSVCVIAELPHRQKDSEDLTLLRMQYRPVRMLASFKGLLQFALKKWCFRDEQLKDSPGAQSLAYIHCK